MSSRITRQLLGDSARELLLAEGRALARVSHPNVVNVHDVGEHDGGVFIAMEYVASGALPDYLEKEQPRPLEITRLFAESARGLAAVHAVGVVHRDFKPANVLVHDDGRALVTDFGVARLHDLEVGTSEGSQNKRLKLTQSGTIVGTPVYMAPEQFESAAVTTAADQFSLGVSLYECKRAAAAQDDDLVALCQVELVGVVGFHQRLFDEARAWELAGEAALTRAGAPADLRANFHYSRGLTLGVQGKLEEAFEHHKLAYEIWNDPEKGNQLDALHALNSMGGIRYRQGRYEDSLALVDEARSRRQELLRPEHPDAIRSLQNSAILLMKVGRRSDARKAYESALDLLDKTGGAQHELRGDVTANLGDLLARMGEHENSAKLLQRSLQHREAVHGLSHPLVAASLGNLGWELMELKRFDEARTALERALKIQREAAGGPQIETADTLGALAALESTMGDIRRAYEIHRDAVAIAEQALESDEHPRLASHLESLSHAAWALGKAAEAQGLVIRALAIKEKTFGNTHQTLVPALLLLGKIERQGNAGASLKWAERAEKILAEGDSPDPGLQCETELAVVEAMTSLGKTKAALERARRARTQLQASGASASDLEGLDRWMAEQGR